MYVDIKPPHRCIRVIYKAGQVYVNPMVDESKAARRLRRRQVGEDDSPKGEATAAAAADDSSSSPEEEYWFDAASPRRPQIKKHLRTSGQRHGAARRGGADSKTKRIFHKFEPQEERRVPSATPNSLQVRSSIVPTDYLILTADLAYLLALTRKSSKFINGGH